MKQKPSKLDAYAGRLEEWFLQGKSLAEAREQLKLDGVSVSLSRLSVWWQQRQSAKAEEQLLAQIASGARQCKEVEAAFAEHPAPELDTIIRLHRVLIMKLSTQAHADPSLLELVARLTKPTMEYAKLVEKRRELELQEAKYRDHVAERKAALEAEISAATGSGGITPATREKIERELNLL